MGAGVRVLARAGAVPPRGWTTRVVTVHRRRTTSYERRLGRAGKAIGASVARGLDRAFGSRAGGRFGILYYHRVGADIAATPVAPMNVTPPRFREQLSGLLDRGYHFASLQAVLDKTERGEPIPPKTVVVTFDDGYRSVYRNAWYVLRELEIPATVFLATAYIGSVDPFPFDPWGRDHRSTAASEGWLPLTWDQCAEMARSDLIDFGTHTHTHEDFRSRPDELAVDLRTSIEVMEERLGERPRLFSFPFGTVRSGFASAELATEARALSLRCALTTEIQLVDPAESPFTWGRFEAVGADSSAALAAKLDGWYEWMAKARALYQGLR
jgi:peptidoglycan/xylan/chitin deacetylase (PgdA/CDA1 family)